MKEVRQQMCLLNCGVSCAATTGLGFAVLAGSVSEINLTGKLTRTGWPLRIRDACCYFTFDEQSKSKHLMG